MNLTRFETKERNEFIERTVTSTLRALEQRYVQREIGAHRAAELMSVLGRVAVPNYADGNIVIPESLEDNTIVIPLMPGEEVRFDVTTTSAQAPQQAKQASYAYSQLGLTQQPREGNNDDGWVSAGLPKGGDGFTGSYTSLSVKNVEGQPHVITESNRPWIFLRHREDEDVAAEGNLAHEVVHYHSRAHHPVKTYASTKDYINQKVSEELEAYHVGAAVEAHFAQSSLWKLVQKVGRQGVQGIKGIGGVNIAMDGLRYKEFGQKGSDYRALPGMIETFHGYGLPYLHTYLDVDARLQEHARK